MRVIWSSRALDDIEEAHRFIWQHNPQAADRLIDTLLRAAARPKHLPEMGRSGRRPGSRELVVASTPYVIMYELGERGVEILRVMHGARRWPPG